MLIFSEKFRLTQADFYADKGLRLSSVLDFFQTVANEHADSLGVGFDDLIKKNTTWVLARIKFTILKDLKSNNVITVETFPHPKGIAGYERDYMIYDDKGELAVKGSSLWVLIDFTTRKILRPFFDYEGEFVNKRAYENKIERIAPISSIPTYSSLVTENDIDRNGHMNNIKYADLMTATAFPKKRETVTINFLSETKKGETVQVSAEESENGVLYTGKIDDVIKFTGKIE